MDTVVPMWSIVLPVKPFGVAKSRLQCTPAARAELARAMALDVLDSIRLAESVRTVVVVTVDDEMTAHARSAGATVLRDRPFLWADPLNQGVTQAARWLGTHRRADGVAVVPSDLAALQPGDLDAVLRAAASREKGFVPDAAGTGTTILTALQGCSLSAAYGEGSAMAHSKRGHRGLTEAPLRSRIDVDTLDDLGVVLPDLGLRTKQVAHALQRSGWFPGAVRSA
ncbi:hypothetical protein ASD11_00885 [Aeromicrobium sp. Root495]|uniref:2-phospho-L-lactate guanylyltransferase n=1 Tax=Aeromicrobium sp. Root495 TaxID=1736550 RepID=UPI0006F689F9|nr:2-phospho-L-lactate guanylyltransferase [Aeromicrobium sp. Root495]KQY58257.1 hypothetical protein ASD11_00885 [Aeromicrobium sp. Root495]